jgi:hypothetical protein
MRATECTRVSADDWIRIVISTNRKQHEATSAATDVIEVL